MPQNEKDNFTIDMDMEYKRWVRAYIIEIKRQMWGFEHDLKCLKEEISRADLSGKTKEAQNFRFQKTQIESNITAHNNRLVKILDIASDLGIKLTGRKEQNGKNNK